MEETSNGWPINRKTESSSSNGIDWNNVAFLDTLINGL